VTFLYPAALLLLAVPALLWLLRSQGGDALRRRFAPELYQKMVARGGGLSRRTRQALLLCAMALAIVALARPVIDRGEIRVKEEHIDLVVAFDISRSMFADDIYPNRFAFAKRKFFDLLEDLKNARVGVIGFSSRAFLVAPLTRDYASLKYLVEHMGFDYVTLKGTDMMAPLQVTANLLKNRRHKALLLFTDGGDSRDFSKEIAYAKKEGIKVFVYAVATKKGGVMKLPDGVVRDRDGQVVVTRLNPAVAKLAEATGGVYMLFSLGKGDMRAMARAIETRLRPEEARESVIHDRRELFYYPLAAAVALFLIGFSSLPRRKEEAA